MNHDTNMTRMPFPDEEVFRMAKSTPAAPLTPAPEPVPHRSRATFAPDEHVYVIKVTMRKADLPDAPESTIGFWCHLCHVNKFDQQQLADMARQAAEVVDQVRLTARRAEMAKSRGADLRKPSTVNEFYFPGDAEFFEAVMCDKFDFRKARTIGAEAQIDPTIRGSKIQPATRSTP